MNTKLFKQRMLRYVFLIAIGVILLVLNVITDSYFNFDTQYISGFSLGIIAVAILMIFKYIRMMKNPEYLKKVKIENNDERNNMISSRAMSYAFVISVAVQAIYSLVLGFLNNPQCEFWGMVVCFEIILYLVIKKVISLKY